MSEYQSLLRRVSGEEFGPLAVLAGAPFAVQIVARDHPCGPAFVAAHEVGVGIAYLTNVGCLNATEAAMLLSELERCRADGMLETVDDFVAACVAQAGDSTQDPWTFAMCNCTDNPIHGCLYLDGQKTSIEVSWRGWLLGYLDDLIARAHIDPRNACNVLAQAADLPMLLEGVVSNWPSAWIPDNIVKMLRARGSA